MNIQDVMFLIFLGPVVFSTLFLVGRVGVMIFHRNDEIKARRRRNSWDSR
jgi:hypothetical protein